MREVYSAPMSGEIRPGARVFKMITSSGGLPPLATSQVLRDPSRRAFHSKPRRDWCESAREGDLFFLMDAFFLAMSHPFAFRTNRFVFMILFP